MTQATSLTTPSSILFGTYSSPTKRRRRSSSKKSQTFIKPLRLSDDDLSSSSSLSNQEDSMEDFSDDGDFVQKALRALEFAKMSGPKSIDPFMSGHILPSPFSSDGTDYSASGETSSRFSNSFKSSSNFSSRSNSFNTDEEPSSGYLEKERSWSFSSGFGLELESRYPVNPPSNFEDFSSSSLMLSSPPFSATFSSASQQTDSFNHVPKPKIKISDEKSRHHHTLTPTLDELPLSKSLSYFGQTTPKRHKKYGSSSTIGKDF